MKHGSLPITDHKLLLLLQTLSLPAQEDDA